MSAPGRFRTADAAVVAGACLAACAVRVPLALQSLWYDEVASYLGYGIRGTGFALTRMYTQANHVLQTVLSAWCIDALGPTEWAMRLPSFLAGLATIPAAWMLGNEAGGPRLGRAAAVAAALMPIAALEATEARGYALMALFATLCTALFLRGLRTQRAGTWALYALCAGLGTWSHLVTVVVPVFHGLWTLAATARAPDAAARRALRAPLAATLAAGAASLLVVAPFAAELLAIRREFLALDGNEPRLAGPEGWMMLLGLGGSWTWWASLAAVPVVAAGAWACRTQPALRRALALAAGGALVALAAPLLGSWLYARFLAFLVPAVGADAPGAPDGRPCPPPWRRSRGRGRWGRSRRASRCARPARRSSKACSAANRRSRSACRTPCRAGTRRSRGWNSPAPRPTDATSRRRSRRRARCACWCCTRARCPPTCSTRCATRATSWNAPGQVGSTRAAASCARTCDARHSPADATGARRGAAPRRAPHVCRNATIGSLRLAMIAG